MRIKASSGFMAGEQSQIYTVEGKRKRKLTRRKSNSKTRYVNNILWRLCPHCLFLRSNVNEKEGDVLFYKLARKRNFV